MAALVTGIIASMSTQELLDPYSMSDELLRSILSERGLFTGDEVGRWQLLEFYNTLVLPKPKREPDPRRLRHSHPDVSSSSANVVLFPESKLDQGQTGSSSKKQQGNTESMVNSSTVTVTSQVVRVSADSKERNIHKRPLPAFTPDEEPPPPKRKITPITYP